MHKKYVYKIWTDRGNEPKWDTASLENICITSDTTKSKENFQTAHTHVISG